MSKIPAYLIALIMLCATAHAAEPARNTILVFGDSLSAGYGIAREQSWPDLLARRLADSRIPYTVANASISGETSAGGRARLDAALAQYQPRLVILELGANDGLRGLPVEQLRDNLSAMAKTARTHGARVLLVGMRLPPNYGPDYVSRFAQVYGDVAKKEKASLLPFLLEPIATDRNAFQQDGLHPVAEVQPKLLDHVWKSLKPLL